MRPRVEMAVPGGSERGTPSTKSEGCPVPKKESVTTGSTLESEEDLTRHPQERQMPVQTRNSTERVKRESLAPSRKGRQICVVRVCCGKAREGAKAREGQIQRLVSQDGAWHQPGGRRR